MNRNPASEADILSRVTAHHAPRTDASRGERAMAEADAVNGQDTTPWWYSDPRRWWRPDERGQKRRSGPRRQNCDGRVVSSR